MLTLLVMVAENKYVLRSVGITLSSLSTLGNGERKKKVSGEINKKKNTLISCVFYFLKKQTSTSKSMLRILSASSMTWKTERERERECVCVCMCVSEWWIGGRKKKMWGRRTRYLSARKLNPFVFSRWSMMRPGVASEGMGIKQKY